MALKFYDRQKQYAYYRIEGDPEAPTGWKLEPYPKKFEEMHIDGYNPVGGEVGDRFGLCVEKRQGTSAWEIWEAATDVYGDIVCLDPIDPAAHTAFEDDERVIIFSTLTAKHLNEIAAAAGL